MRRWKRRKHLCGYPTCVICPLKILLAPMEWPDKDWLTNVLQK